VNSLRYFPARAAADKTMTARPSNLNIDDFKASRSDTTRYLAFVDGLRAISILAVVGFHVGMPGFSGGFVGVDIFFVISGFLIINQIKDGLETGRFSILTFYRRRALRILPVFILVLLCVFVLAPLILPTPGVYSDFMMAAVSAPLMLSNVLFYLRQGYFDIAADQKPLLHTWTLSVEEQFYLLTPLILVVMFYLGRRRFGTPAALLAMVIALVSLAGAITQTSTDGRNAAFFLPHWRAWEFVAGGLIVAPAVAAVRRAPRPAVEFVGAIGVAAIVLAIITYDSKTPFPSWRAVLPVAGATLTILAGIAQPRITVARLLALPWLVAIGLVSYGWYLWHWPILSFIRISRLGEPSLLINSAGAGLLAFGLACASYRFIERPIRQWQRSLGEFQYSRRIVTAGVAACLATALIGGASGFAGYRLTQSFLAERYGIEGQGVLDNGCRILASSVIPEHCLHGRLAILLGDSHADALFGSFARRFEQEGIRLISIARGGCNPILFAPSQRSQNRQHGCNNLLGPFEQLLAQTKQLSSVVITSTWANRDLLTPEHLSELVAQFDPTRTRVLIIGPVPIFPTSSLECVVLSDRHRQNRERCGRPRQEVEADRGALVQVLSNTAIGFDNVHYVDPIDLFCDTSTCRPFKGNQVFFRDQGHVLPAGADRIYDGFASDFHWLAGAGQPRTF
jgi:peptidoglycan/LPS O-acetylase OafA/YrhL